MSGNEVIIFKYYFLKFIILVVEIKQWEICNVLSTAIGRYFLKFLENCLGVVVQL